MRTQSVSHFPNSWTGRISVLMLDANAGDQRLMSEALSTIGECGFVAVRNRDEALRQMRERWPDLIILTLDSEMEGLHFLEVVKSDHDWLHIPVAVFAGGSGPNEGAIVRSLGACSYLQKPIDFEGHLRLATELVALTQVASNDEAAARATQTRLQ